LAPERLAGEPATAASEQYAAGVVLYEVLTGVAPFAADHPLALVQAIQHGQAEPVRERRPEVPPGVAGAVERAIAADPTRRHPSVAALHDAIAAAPMVVPAPTMAMAATAAAPTAALPVAAVLAEPAPRDPRPWGVWIVILAALLLVGGLALAARGDGSGFAPSTTTTLPAAVVTTTAPPTTAAPTTTVPPTTKPPKGHGGGGNGGD
jgi:serine/threonine-protein kinase